MKTKTAILLAALLSPLVLQAQTAAPVPLPGPPPQGTVIYSREMGKWWQNSDVVKKLQLSDGQISQLEQIFYDHRMHLIDFGAEMEKQDLKLQSLLDADVPNEGQVDSQVDQVLAARGRLEREYTMMNLDLRKVLSLEQWRQLKSIRGDEPGFGNHIFFHKIVPPNGAPLPPDAAPLPPLPPPPDGMF
jgi:Spy/CpxP family protein refolding chaperone